MRHWTSVATFGACLLASACGADGEPTARADREDESIGGERAAGELDSYAAYDLSVPEPLLPQAGPAGMTEAETPPAEGDRLAQGAPPEIGAAEPGAAPAGEICPADIADLTVRVSTIPRGSALAFTASHEDVEDLRARLDRFAELHRQRREARAREGIAAEGIAAEGEAPGDAMQDEARFADTEALIHQATDVRVVDIPRGARLEVRFEDGARAGDLRAELREDAAMLRDGRCPLALQIEMT